MCRWLFLKANLQVSRARHRAASEPPSRRIGATPCKTGLILALICPGMAKKSSKVPVIIVVGSIAAVGYFWLKSQMRLISFGAMSIPFQQLKGSQLNLGLRLPILNASALAARVTGFTGFILSPSGAQVGTVFLAEPAVVQRYAQNELKFNASISLTALLSEIGGGVLAGGKLPSKPSEILAYLQNYKIVGQLRVYGLPMPLEMPLI
jgi:hypothetical protein